MDRKTKLQIIGFFIGGWWGITCYTASLLLKTPLWVLLLAVVFGDIVLAIIVVVADDWLNNG
jgi:hypothetical protein